MSRNTVRKYLKPPETDTVSAARGSVHWYDGLNWPDIIHLVGRGVTIKQLHADFAPDGVTYWAFRRYLLTIHTKAKISISVRQEHEPGKTIQLDYTHGLTFHDAATGQEVKTHLFCAVLPFSSKIYADFVLDQKIPSFLASQERMWRSLGGITPYVVIDNLKAGVKRAHLYDPDLNPTYCDFANHYGFAVLPARPYHPKDKAAVEAAIGVLQRTFYQQMRERRFYSLADMNDELARFLVGFNAQIMKDHDASRDQRFAAEKALLLPLPAATYDLAEWRDAKVHPDCCIQIQRNLYSVPHVYVGQTVRVKVTAAVVTVYDQNHDAVAIHRRLTRPGQTSINEGHYPEHKMQISRYEIQQCRRRAREIGSRTSELVEYLFNDARPLRHLRRAQGMLRLFDRAAVSAAGLEYAAAQALTFRRFRLAYIEDCARNFDQNKNPRVIQAPIRDPGEIFLHNEQRETESDRTIKEADFFP
ncbi:MAG: IS21 family transposase [Proteobacteria bacterium]|nr:IS21 family transposase [Pseudomonadota bacterium]